MAKDKLKSDQKVRAAWMYYIAGKNQTDIANELGLSRPVVQRLISSAKEEGIVSVGLHHPIARCLDYAELLQARYQLKECNIVPSTTESETRENVAFGCYQLMAKYLENQAAASVGIGSGKTLKKALKRINFTAPECQCISLVSAMSADGLCNYYDDVALKLAQKLEANYYQHPAPRYALSEQEHQFWLSSRLFKEIEQRADKTEVIFIGLGSLNETGPLIKDGFLSPQEAKQLGENGAVGEILGRIVNADGQPADCGFNRLLTSYDIRQNQQTKIASACGEEKRAVILAALKGGWINGLVTDEDTARWLLSQ